VVRIVFYYEAVWQDKREVTIWRGMRRSKHSPTLSSLVRLSRVVGKVTPFVGGWMVVM